MLCETRFFILKIFSAAIFLSGILSLFTIQGEIRFSPLPVAALSIAVCGWVYFCSIFFQNRLEYIWEAFFICGASLWCAVFLLFLDTGRFLSEIWRETMAAAITVSLFIILKKFTVSFFDSIYDNEFENRKYDAVSFHEAGHICVSSLYSSSSVRVDVQGLSGYVVCNGNLDDKVVMLQLLAGMAAEELVFGMSRGGHSDIVKWHLLASKWLNDNNIPQDRKMELLYRQRKYLMEFFHENSSLLSLMATAIRDRRQMTDDDLRHYLGMIVKKDYKSVFSGL